MPQRATASWRPGRHTIVAVSARIDGEETWKGIATVDNSGNANTSFKLPDVVSRGEGFEVEFVTLKGETVAVVPRTTTGEVHRYKANATDKRTLTRLTPEGQ